MLRQQSSFFSSESPMMRVKALIVALKIVVWKYINAHFSNLQAITNGDIDEAIHRIYGDYPKYHRLPDIIGLYKIISALQENSKEIESALTVINKPDCSPGEFVKEEKHYKTIVNNFAKKLAKYYEKLEWKVSHTKYDTYTFVFKTKCHERKRMIAAACENPNLYYAYYRQRKIKYSEYVNQCISPFKKERKEESNYRTDRGQLITYGETGLKGEMDYSSLASSIKDLVINNPSINLKDLCKSFEEDMVHLLREKGLAILKIKHEEKAKREAASQELFLEKTKQKFLIADNELKDKQITLLEDERNKAIMSVSTISDELVSRDNQIRKLELEKSQLHNEVTRKTLRVRGL